VVAVKTVYIAAVGYGYSQRYYGALVIISYCHRITLFVQYKIFQCFVWD